VLNKPLVDIRKELCEDYWNTKCNSEQCFDGKFNSTEVDGIIIRGNDFCLLEYEETRKSLCNNFLKFYRLQQLLAKPFESLFVTRVSTKEDEGSTTFESFNKYIDSIKPILDKLLQNWMIVEIVDLHSDKKKRFHFRP